MVRGQGVTTLTPSSCRATAIGPAKRRLRRLQVGRDVEAPPPGQEVEPACLDVDLDVRRDAVAAGAVGPMLPTDHRRPEKRLEGTKREAVPSLVPIQATGVRLPRLHVPPSSRVEPTTTLAVVTTPPYTPTGQTDG